MRQNFCGQVLVRCVKGTFPRRWHGIWMTERSKVLTVTSSAADRLLPRRSNCRRTAHFVLTRSRKCSLVWFSWCDYIPGMRIAVWDTCTYKQMMTVGFKITKNIQTRTNMWKPLTDQYGWNRASLAVRAYYLPLAVLVSHWDTFAVTLMWHLKDIASCCLYCPCFKCHCCVRCSVVIWTVCKSVPHLDSKMIIFVLCGTFVRSVFA